MPEETRYQGWANYETWAVKLWMDNDEGSYLYWKEATREAWAEAEADDLYTSKEQCARINLAERIKDEHEETLPEITGFAADLLNAAFGEVDWYEIADSLIRDARENDELGEEDD